MQLSLGPRFCEPMKFPFCLNWFQWSLCHLQPETHYTKRCFLTTNFLEAIPISLPSIPGHSRGCGQRCGAGRTLRPDPFTQGPSPNRWRTNHLPSVPAPSSPHSAALCCLPLATSCHVLNSLGPGGFAGYLTGARIRKKAQVSTEAASHSSIPKRILSLKIRAKKKFPTITCRLGILLSSWGENNIVIQIGRWICRYFLPSENL